MNTSQAMESKTEGAKAKDSVKNSDVNNAEGPSGKQQIKNIDQNGSNCLKMVLTYADDIYINYFLQEKIQTIDDDYLQQHSEVTPELRTVLIDWLVTLHLDANCVAETLHLCVKIVDCYLQNDKNFKKDQLQLLGVTAFLIAAKFEEVAPPKLIELVDYADDDFTKKDVISMEVKVLKKINMNLNKVLSIYFTRWLLKYCSLRKVQYTMAKYFCELALVDYELVSCLPSKLAAAAIFLCLHLNDETADCPSGLKNSYWTETLRSYSRYSAEDLRSTTKKLSLIALKAKHQRLKAVYLKYKSSTLLQVATKLDQFEAQLNSILQN